MQAKSFNQLFDEAIATLPYLRRKIVERHFRRRPQDREECCERAMLAMSENPEVIAMSPSLARGLADGAVSADAALYTLDLDQLERFLQILITYLPKILEIILPLFLTLVPFILTLTILGGSNAHAQETRVCAGGVCSIVRGTVARVADVVAPERAQYVSYSNAVASSSVVAPSVGEAQRTVLYAANRETVWVESGSQNAYRYPLRSSVAAIGNRGRVAVQAIRGNRPVATLLATTGQKARNLVSTVRPSSVRARIRARACR